MIIAMLLYGVLGAVAGLLAGLLGVGGGIVIVPMLQIAFSAQGLPPDQVMHLALGTSMGSIMFTSLSSSRAHSRSGYVDWSLVRRIAPGILIGTYIGSAVATHLSTAVLQVIFVVFLCYVAYNMLFGKKPKPSRQLPGLAGISGAGGFIGFISSLVGIGGGTLSVPFLLWHNVEMHRAIGTSAAIGFPIAVAGSISYVINGYGMTDLPPYSLGFLYLPALLGIVLVSMFTAPVGTRIAHKLPVDKLKKCFACLLLLVGARMLFLIV